MHAKRTTPPLVAASDLLQQALAILGKEGHGEGTHIGDRVKCAVDLIRIENDFQMKQQSHDENKSFAMPYQVLAEVGMPTNATLEQLRRSAAKKEPAMGAEAVMKQLGEIVSAQNQNGASHDI